MADALRGITCPDMTRVIRAALQQGWRWVGISGSTHAVIEWRTGDKVRFGLTPSVASWKTTATEIQRISGIVVWNKGNRKRSRKSVRSSGFNLYKPDAYSPQWVERVDQLRAEHEALTTQFCELAISSTGSREDMCKAAGMLRQIRAVERQLENYHQPVRAFQPV